MHALGLEKKWQEEQPDEGGGFWEGAKSMAGIVKSAPGSLYRNLDVVPALPTSKALYGEKSSEAEKMAFFDETFREIRLGHEFLQVLGRKGMAKLVGDPEGIREAKRVSDLSIQKRIRSCPIDCSMHLARFGGRYQPSTGCGAGSMAA